MHASSAQSICPHARVGHTLLPSAVGNTATMQVRGAYRGPRLRSYRTLQALSQQMRQSDESCSSSASWYYLQASPTSLDAIAARGS